MYNNNNEQKNVPIRTLYAPNYSCLIMSYFKASLVLNFRPYVGQDQQGFDQYSDGVHLSTSLNPDGASFFYMQACQILDGKVSGEPIEAVFTCKNDTTLVFEYKPDENKQMIAYLTINKNNRTIRFRFATVEYDGKTEDGREFTAVIQTGLGIFAVVLGCYIAGSAANLNYLDKHNILDNELQEMIAQSQIEEHVKEEWERKMAEKEKANNQGQS
jgi:hypothetical protein